MPLRSPKMYSFIFGFQRFVWCPKWTPASSSSLILTVVDKYRLLVVSITAGTPPWRPAFRPPPGDARGGSWLTLAELEPTPGALLPVLLALLDARVARQEAGLLEPL